MIRVILWDIDGTILNFTEAEKQAIRSCFSAFGLGECPDEMLARYSAINTTYWKRLERGEISKAEVLRGRFEEFFRKEGIAFNEVDAFNERYQVSLGDTIVFNDDSYELIRRLKGRVRQYAVTNGTKKAQVKKLARSGLDQLFDGVFISEEVGAEKPSPAFFDRVWQEIGSYEKEEVLIVGDSLTSDMQGGVNAGIPCCWYNPEGISRPKDLPITYEIRDLQQIENII